MTDSPYTTDTSPEAEAMQLDAIRRMTPAERVGIAMRLTTEMIRQSKAALGRRFPGMSDADIALKFIELHYGAELADAVRARRRDSGS